MAAQVAEFSKYVGWVLARPGSSRFFLGGFVDNYTVTIAHLVAVVAPASLPLPDKKTWKAHYELDMLMLDG